ncbi:response regulator transcription factor [Clostridiales bacterium]|nr:response regulator transcription factor [Clostridiales bacterium]
MYTVFMVEDDPNIRMLTGMHLQLAGYAVRELEDAAAARAALAEEKPALVLLDIMMPGEDGFSLGESLIREGIPVIFLTAKTAVTDRVRGLRLGAQDYILKPFEPAELLARVENTLKRTQAKTDVYERGDLKVNFETREVWRGGKPVTLTTLEFNLLKTLIESGRTAMSRDELLNAVWGYNYIGETRTVDVHIQRLRGKIGAERIETIIRYGYRFREDV